MLQEGMIPGNSILPPEAPSSCILASLPRALLSVRAPLWSPATTGFRQARGGPPPKKGTRSRSARDNPSAQGIQPGRTPSARGRGAPRSSEDRDSLGPGGKTASPGRGAVPGALRRKGGCPRAVNPTRLRLPGLPTPMPSFLSPLRKRPGAPGSRCVSACLL